jgi:hypothetical protein
MQFAYCFHDFILCYLESVEPIATVMASDDPKMSKQGTAGKMKHITLTVCNRHEIGDMEVGKVAVWL